MDETEVKEILDHKALRDRFAIAAIPVALSAARSDIHPEILPEVCAVAAYKVADAMLKERDR